MESNNLFNNCQHGFRKHRSCVTQLLEVLNDLTNFIDNKENVDIIYLDFSKAFDTVPHKRLLNKLQANGIEGNILKWIESFLTDRKQRVKTNSSYSTYSSVKSGIPQGSILGPLLFIIFINDLPECVESLCKIFADDTKIYNTSSKNQILQKDLHALMKWSEKWQLGFNIIKCCFLTVGNNKNNSNNSYYMDLENKNKLKVIEQEKDVGVIFSKNLKFDEHIDSIVKKANNVTGLIKRSFSYLDEEMFIKLYKSLVRPHLEYANVIWHPQFKRQSQLIEKVQRRATKLLTKLKDKPYHERLMALKLPSLKFRQTRADMIQTYKILNNIDNVNRNDFLKFCSRVSRDGDIKLFKPYARTNLRTNFFSNRIIDTWNSLSLDTKNATSINSFKQGIDNDLFHLYYNYDY